MIHCTKNKEKTSLSEGLHGRAMVDRKHVDRNWPTVRACLGDSHDFGIGLGGKEFYQKVGKVEVEKKNSIRGGKVAKKVQGDSGGIKADEDC